MNKHPGFTRKYFKDIYIHRLGSSFGYKCDGRIYSGKI